MDDPMHCYMLTNVKYNGNTLDDGDDNVVVFAKHATLDQIRKAFGSKGFTWDESYEMPAKDLQFHLHQALYLEEREEAKIKQLANAE
jgi:hypothetical protein